MSLTLVARGPTRYGEQLMARTVLIIDDEQNMRWVLDRALQKAGYEVVTASRGDEGLRLFARHAIDLVLLDLKMPGMDGLSVLRELRKRSSQIPIFLLTAYATVPTAVEALKIGATDYVRKPFDLEELQTKISYAFHAAAQSTNLPPSSSITLETPLVGISPAITRLHPIIVSAATNDYPVLLVGETGSGCSTLARLLHDKKGAPSKEHFLIIDCGALPLSLVTRELGRLLLDEEQEPSPSVGHPDRWEQALGGTLYIANLDQLRPEIIERFSQNVQHYLKSAQRPHGLRLIISMREEPTIELFELLPSSVVIEVPPLRHRTEDIPLLLAHFVPKLKWREDVLELLKTYLWPGNISELRQTITYASTLSDGHPIDVCHLPSTITQHSASQLNAETVTRLDLPEDGIDLEAIEKNLIEQALARTSNKTQAARLLGISRPTLLYRLGKYGL